MTTLRREEVRLALRFGGLHVTRALLSLLSIAAIGWLTDTLVDRRIGQAMVVLVGFGVITTLGYLSEPLGTYVKNVGTARLEERLTPQIMRAMTSVPSVDLLCVEPRATFERLVPEAPRTIVKLHASTWLLVEIFIQCIGISAMMANAGAGFLMIPSWIILLFFSFVGIRLGLVRARFDRSIGVQRSRGAYLMSIFTDREPAEEVRSFDVIEPFLSEWNRVNASARRSLDLREWIYYGFLKLPVLGVSAALGLQLVGPARRLVDGGISIGTFVSLVLGLLSLLTSISWSLSESFENWGQAYAQRRELLRLIGGISGADPAQTFAERAPRGPLQLHDVCFRFPNQDRTVLEVPDLLLEPGKRYVITGPNGSGKTTLMRCLSRIFTERDGGGTLTVVGTGDTLHAGDLAVVVQDPHPFPISARAFASPGLEPRQEGLFEVLHGSAFAGSPDALVAKGAPGGLGASGGELKRMALWRALSSSAPAIILDEPSVWLDQDRCAWLDQVLRTSWSDRIVVMVSHDERLIETADVVLHLEDGRLIESEVTHDAT